MVVGIVPLRLLALLSAGRTSSSNEPAIVRDVKLDDNQRNSSVGIVPFNPLLVVKLMDVTTRDEPMSSVSSSQLINCHLHACKDDNQPLLLFQLLPFVDK